MTYFLLSSIYINVIVLFLCSHILWNFYKADHITDHLCGMYDKIIERVQNRLCLKRSYSLLFIAFTSGAHTYLFLIQPTVRSRRIFSLPQTRPSTYFDNFFILRHLISQNKKTIDVKKTHQNLDLSILKMGNLSDKAFYFYYYMRSTIHETNRISLIHLMMIFSFETLKVLWKSFLQVVLRIFVQHFWRPLLRYVLFSHNIQCNPLRPNLSQSVPPMLIMKKKMVWIFFKILKIKNIPSVPKKVSMFESECSGANTRFKR